MHPEDQLRGRGGVSAAGEDRPRVPKADMQPPTVPADPADDVAVSPVTLYIDTGDASVEETRQLLQAISDLSVAMGDGVLQFLVSEQSDAGSEGDDAP